MKPYINEKTVQFDTVSLLRVPLLAGVVFIHCNMLEDPDVTAAAVELFAEFIWWFNTLCLSTCVPTFFIISGYLFFRGATNLNRTFYRGKWRSRWRSLVVPYFLWNFIGLCLTFYKASPLSGGMAEAYSAYWPAHQSPGSWLCNVATGFFQLTTVPYPYDFPLWFICDLIIFVIISPIIGYTLQRFGRWSLAVIFVCCLTMYQITDWSQFRTMIYFSLGAWCSYYISLNINRRVLYAVMAIAIGCVASLYLVEMSAVATNVVVILKNVSIAVLAYFLAKHFVRRGATVSTGARSAAFFVYAFHGLYCTQVRKMLTRFFSVDTNIGCFEIYLSTFLILVVTSLAVYWTLNKLSPRITSVLCGGR